MYIYMKRDREIEGDPRRRSLGGAVEPRVSHGLGIFAFVCAVPRHVGPGAYELNTSSKTRNTRAPGWGFGAPPDPVNCQANGAHRQYTTPLSSTLPPCSGAVRAACRSHKVGGHGRDGEYGRAPNRVARGPHWTRAGWLRRVGNNSHRYSTHNSAANHAICPRARCAELPAAVRFAVRSRCVAHRAIHQGAMDTELLFVPQHAEPVGSETPGGSPPAAWAAECTGAWLANPVARAVLGLWNPLQPLRLLQRRTSVHTRTWAPACLCGACGLESGSAATHYSTGCRACYSLY